LSYEAHFNFLYEPFSNIPDPRFYYNSPEHHEAMIRLMHSASMMRGLAVLTGDIGTGKTTLSRKLLSELRKDGKFIEGLLVLTHSDFSPEWFLQKIGWLLGMREMGTDKMKLVNQLSRRLMQLRKENKRPILLIDEANKLKNEEHLEELRGLLNLELSDTRLITFILSGLPALEDSLNTNRPLSQRIAMRVELHTLSSESSRNYIIHRLSVAGGKETIFTDGAYNLIFKYSTGCPRLINSICDNGLLEGYILKKNIVDESLIEKVAENFKLKS